MSYPRWQFVLSRDPGLHLMRFLMSTSFTAVDAYTLMVENDALRITVSAWSALSIWGYICYAIINT